MGMCFQPTNNDEEIIITNKMHIYFIKKTENNQNVNKTITKNNDNPNVNKNMKNTDNNPNVNKILNENYYKIKNSKINIFWLDPNVDNEENTEYKRRLENLGYEKIKCFKTIEEGINSLKSIKFEETFIIVSGGFYFNFIEVFKEDLKDIYVIPKIVVFTQKKKHYY